MSGRAGFDGVERGEQKNIARSEGVLEAGDTSNEDAVADAKWGKVREEKRGGEIAVECPVAIHDTELCSVVR